MVVGVEEMSVLRSWGKHFVKVRLGWRAKNEGGHVTDIIMYDPLAKKWVKLLGPGDKGDDQWSIDAFGE